MIEFDTLGLLILIAVSVLTGALAWGLTGWAINRFRRAKAYKPVKKLLRRTK